MLLYNILLDDKVIINEDEKIKLDGLNAAQLRELNEHAEKFTFQAEVNRMMKLIINSLYRNKEVYSSVILKRLYLLH